MHACAFLVIHHPVNTQSLVQNIVRSTLSLTFVIALVRVVYNIKGRMFREMAWQLEVKGDVTRQRRVEAIDKIMSVLTLIVGAVFGFQALGLDSACTDDGRSMHTCSHSQLGVDHRWYRWSGGRFGWSRNP